MRQAPRLPDWLTVSPSSMKKETKGGEIADVYQLTASIHRRRAPRPLSFSETVRNDIESPRMTIRDLRTEKSQPRMNDGAKLLQERLAELATMRETSTPTLNLSSSDLLPSEKIQQLDVVESTEKAEARNAVKLAFEMLDELKDLHRVLFDFDVRPQCSIG